MLRFLQSAKWFHSKLPARPVKDRECRVVGIAARMVEDPVWCARVRPERYAPALRYEARPARQPPISTDAREPRSTQIDAPQGLPGGPPGPTAQRQQTHPP